MNSADKAYEAIAAQKLDTVQAATIKALGHTPQQAALFAVVFGKKGAA